MNGQDKIYKMITDQILAKLDEGVVAWQKPWVGMGMMPVNLKSKKHYRGINIFLLALRGFDSTYWVTFKQAKEMGGSVKKGEKGTHVIFWKFIEKKDDKGDVVNRYGMLRYYTVFNIEQCEGLEKKIPHVETFDNDKIDACEAIWEKFSAKPELTHKGTQAFYSPLSDSITLPKMESFKSSEEYYSTLFHEAGHSTGHSSRLNREGISSFDFKGSHKYSKEELVTEFCATFLCGMAGIERATIDNSAAYIDNWASRLKKDHKIIVQAAAQAQKAADWVLDADTHFVERAA